MTYLLLLVRMPTVYHDGDTADEVRRSSDGECDSSRETETLHNDGEEVGDRGGDLFEMSVKNSIRNVFVLT